MSWSLRTSALHTHGTFLIPLQITRPSKSIYKLVNTPHPRLKNSLSRCSFISMSFCKYVSISSDVRRRNYFIEFILIGTESRSPSPFDWIHIKMIKFFFFWQTSANFVDSFSISFDFFGSMKFYTNSRAGMKCQRTLRNKFINPRLICSRGK